MNPETIAIGVGLGMGLAVLGAGIGQGLTASSAASGIARQPEASGKIQTAMIIGMALIESLVIFTFVIMNGMSGKIPNFAATGAPQTSIQKEDKLTNANDAKTTLEDGTVVAFEN
jgi:F-type H+-transporting ATPase subunit c